MRSYRVWELGSPNDMKIEDLPDLVPGQDEIVVDVEAAGVGFVDTLVVSGRYQNIPPAPFTPGMEFAGTVRSIGAGVTGCKAGDRLAAYVLNGGFAEQAIAKVGEFYAVPDDVPLDQAALLCGAYLTAYFALVERGGFRRGETVLVGGAGGAVGLAAVQIARALGATRVLGAFRSDADRQAILDAGADAAIDLSGPDLREAVRSQVLEATDGQGADVVLDPIGGEFLSAALRATAWSGRLVVIGFAAGDIPTVKVNYLLLKNIGILGLDLSQYRRRAPDRLKAAQAELFDLWRQGLLKPRIARQFPFEAIPEALNFVAGGRTGGRASIAIGRTQV
ncbi:NADPH:quinone oxidoreductase family protein [Mesorhizobium sp. YR577]|uniref:NADPH:quinone oxidoreductase family protein n=1 Tax=Mesorhizobium sp. YR577 TaxID=1884373 RepID=UPI0008F121A5|nr:NADPH:quinone oxidoreductase family protein [Mesorhizobium sp. YR577]SFU16923.1 NADPH2:quinone reductase [Mesorhizobium sp. YR577]